MTTKEFKPLKLIAFDAEDLAILAAHLQDAVIKVPDLAYLKSERRFAFVANRFDWESALAAEGRFRAKPYTRRQAGVRFEHVTGAQLTGIDRSDTKAVLSLLTIQFEPGAEAPEGHVTLSFAGGGAIRLSVSCIEAEMRDLGAAWATAKKPDHPDST